MYTASMGYSGVKENFRGDLADGRDEIWLESGDKKDADDLECALWT